MQLSITTRPFCSYAKGLLPSMVTADFPATQVRKKESIRAFSPVSRFTDTGNRTITDQPTGLPWLARIAIGYLLAIFISLVLFTSASAAPSAPSLISPGSSSSPGQTITNLTPLMRWNHVPGATGYGLYVSDLSAGGTLVYDNDSVPYADSLTLPAGTLVTGHSYRWNMRAKDASGWSGYSSRLFFKTAGLAPEISSVSPSTMVGSTSIQTLRITGNNFDSTGAVLLFDPPTGSDLTSSASKFTSRSPTRLDYSLNNYNDAGTWRVRVKNGDGQTSDWVNFSVTPGKPAISSVSPTSMPASTSSQALSVNGSAFDGGAELIFDPPTGPNLTSSPSKFSSRSGTLLNYNINNANDAGTWSVQVRNSDGQTSGWATFTVMAANPTISSVSPTSMPGSTSEQTLLINGSNFDGGAELLFDPPTGPNLTSRSNRFNDRSSTRLEYRINNDNDLGTWGVQVRNSDGRLSNRATLVVTAAGAWSISPATTTVGEAAGSVSFSVRRGSSAAPALVYASTVQNLGSANNGDYVGIENKPLNYQVGQTAQTLTIAITNDVTVEASESYRLIVQESAADPTSTYLATATFTIADDDGSGTDSDNDGVPDTTDNCPSDSNPGQNDNDGDGQGDVCDADDDNDGVNDATDNCPGNANNNQTDADGDGIGDVCDAQPDQAKQVCKYDSIRASTPKSRFTDNGDGTVTDKVTGLQWKRCAEGQTWSGGTCTGSATTHTWQQGLQLADTASYASHNDWRMPNIKELSSIIERACSKPAINLAVFPATPYGVSFWSSSPSAYYTYAAWVGYFSAGTAYFSYKSDYPYHYVRLVRGGQ